MSSTQTTPDENASLPAKMKQILVRFSEKAHDIRLIALIAILLLGTFLRFYQLGANGVGNTYYAAAVKSMLMSWKNFFFVAFEPGGSLSLDKPPLGFWAQAVSAYFLGVNGFALALPNALAGVGSILLVYKLVRRPFGAWAGLAAALALALTPVAIATERNNTIDGLLVFVLLLAAWAFLESVYTAKARWLFLGAFLVGLGFNIKMLQAFMPLPAFYAVYFLCAKQPWLKKIVHLAASSALLLVVSFSWAVIVDLTPAANRPYVDSTKNNRVMELIFGHNGIERLISMGRGMGFGGQRNRPGGGNFNPGQPPQGGAPGQPPQGGFPGQPAQGYTSDRQNPAFPSSNTRSFGRMGGGRQPGGMWLGQAGPLRLFSQSLAGQASWLLPFVLAGLILIIAVLWKRPFGEIHHSAILWTVWFVPSFLYFTFSQGLMHEYYLIMLGAPAAALFGVALWSAWQIIQPKPLLGWSLLLLLGAAALACQLFWLWEYSAILPWAAGAAGLLLLASLALAILSRSRRNLSAFALAPLAVSLCVAPGIWSALTTLNNSANQALPSAGPGMDFGQGGMHGPGRPNNNRQGSTNAMLDFLLANTEPGTYLVAVNSANEAGSYILQTGRPVLTFGGFLNQYEEVTVEQLAALVENGQLRFVANQGMDRRQEISSWLAENCEVIYIGGDSSAGSTPSFNAPGNRDANNNSLYDCGG